MEIREVRKPDLTGLLTLYTHLHDNPLPEQGSELFSLWEEILGDRNHHIVVAADNGVIISSCVIVIVPNLTHQQRSYALIENVVTHPSVRNRGIATACLNYARDLAIKERCYKIMLLTGSKLDGTLCFYERAGYNRHDKTAFIQWLDP
jgi:GNAT superfamily N-acetyltransferase